MLATADDVEVEPHASTFGAPLGRVSVRRSTTLGSGTADRLRRAWQVAIAVEAAALMRPAIAQTVAHVSTRYQFGRPIGSFQAVQHRLARAYAMAEATAWLGRRAAWFNQEEFLTASAAAYACAAAALTYANTHQVSGAIGITTEYGLNQRTLRLVALQRVLGGRRSHARHVAAARRRMDLRDVPMPVHPVR
jgi:alkylation response protein AidB-like acyl-CoA dehydrogenase